MKQDIQFFSFVRKNITTIKYSMLVFAFFSAIITTKTYINYLAIQETISNTNIQIEKQKDQIAYTENFLLNFFDSEYKNYFFRHKNGILNHHEKIIQVNVVADKKPESSVQNYRNLNNSETGNISPAESRNQFFREKWENI